MRSREEIEKRMEKLNHSPDDPSLMYNLLMMEVLLDIRDLLTPEEKPIKPFGGDN